MSKAIPDGYHSLTPYFVLSDAAKAIEFYKAALGATELYRLSLPGGKVAHAELQVGNSRFMVGDEMPEWMLSQRVEDVSPEEMQRRMEKLGG